MRKPPTVRQISINAMNQWEEGKLYAETLINNATKGFNLPQEDRNLLKAILVDTIRNLRKIDFWISQLRDGKLDTNTRNALRVGLCQLHILDIPHHAAVNETVSACKKSIRGLVNAILRKSLREAEELEEAISKQSIAIQLSHPDWLSQKWENAFGKEDALKLLHWNQKPSKTIFRLNTLKNDVHLLPNEVDNILQVEGHPDFFISKGLPPKAWIDDGMIYIQDPATSHAIELLAPLPGEVILDACAAPGGKSSQIAAHMQNSGKLICTDSNAKRIPRLEENLTRLGVNHATCQEHDWTNPPPQDFIERFNGILLDVPCSNTGVLRRRVDARWRLKSEEISALRKLQKSILKNAIPCLKKGGRLVYSTCSIDHSENSELIQETLAEYDFLQLVKEHQSYPHSHQTDGAYAAVLKHK